MMIKRPTILQCIPNFQTSTSCQTSYPQGPRCLHIDDAAHPFSLFLFILPIPKSTAKSHCLSCLRDMLLIIKSVCNQSSAQVPARPYELVGVIEHMGSMRAGHYVAYTRRPVQPHTEDAPPSDPPPPSSSSAAAEAPAEAAPSSAAAAAAAAAARGLELAGKMGKAAGTEDGRLEGEGRTHGRECTAATGAMALESEAGEIDGNDVSWRQRGQQQQQQQQQQSKCGSSSGSTTSGSTTSGSTTSAGPAQGVAKLQAGTVGGGGANDCKVGTGTGAGCVKEAKCGQGGAEGGVASAGCGGGAAGGYAWFHISDTVVKQVTEAQVLRAQAYVLMYAQA